MKTTPTNNNNKSVRVQRAPTNSQTKSVRVFFILGRNPELSRLEVLEFLKARNRTHKEILFEENFLIIETNEGERFDIQEFGGVMWLGQITLEGTHQEFIKHIDQNEIIPADKFSYAVFGNQDAQILKDKFKERKKKAMMKHGRKRIEFQGGEKHELPKANFYIFYHEHNSIIYFGTATQGYDNTEVKNRDMNKPVRREFLAISPRLSKILINLSGAKTYDLLLDPFCGIGGILQEDLLKRINVYGIDKDKQAIAGTEANLKWLATQYKVGNRYTIENDDSRRAPDLQFNAVATETPLGEVLREKVSDNQVKQIILNFEAYIIPILRRIKAVKKSSAKIAITFPTIRMFRVNVQKIAEKTGLKIYIGPIL
ncbi:MAG: hypothetical protein ABIF18_04305, partial [archaeon]